MSVSSKFTIGQVDGSPLRVDVLQLVNSKALIQANSGGGKSWLMRLIAERVAGKVQLIILDPEGEFSTLREKLDMALVGPGGELPADVRAAGLLARKITETGISAVIDLYELKLPKRREFVRRFLEELIDLPKTLWHPMIVMLDEAQVFAPEKGHGEAESLDAVISLMSQGRKRGFAGILATQRLAKLHKDAAADANNVFIGRTWLDVDQKRAGDILGMGKADRVALRDLEPGVFLAFGPALSTKGITQFRSDPVITTHPKPGERHLMAVPPASKAIQEIVRHIGDLPAQAAEEVRDLEAAKRRMAELERQLRARPVQVEQKVERVVERVEIPVFSDGELSRLEAAAASLLASGKQIADVGQEISSALRTAAAIRVPPPSRRELEFVGRRPIAVAPARVSPRDAPPPASMPKAERKILTVLAQYPQGRTQTQVALLASYASSGGGFLNAVGGLRSKGWLEGDKQQLRITSEGHAAIGGAWEPLPPPGPELVDHWMRSLSKAERTILHCLAYVYPSALSKDEVADRTGYVATGGGFLNALGKLRTLELIKGSRELLSASEDLFG